MYRLVGQEITLRNRFAVSLAAILLAAACAGPSQEPEVPDFETALACDSSELTLQDAREGEIPEWDDPRMQLIRRVARGSSDEAVKEAAGVLARTVRVQRRKAFTRAARAFRDVCREQGWQRIGFPR